MSFIENIIARAIADKKKIVLPESEDPRVIEAASKLLARQVADIVLLGKREHIERVAPDFSLDGAEIIDPENSPYYEGFVKRLVELRQAKGMTEEKARETMKMATPFGVMMVKEGLADGLVAGSIGSTADTLRPALQILKTKPGTKLVSAFFMMVVDDPSFGDDGTMLFSDCGLNEFPTAEQLADIAGASADSYEALTEKKARVAMLSYSSKGSAFSDSVTKVQEATELVKANYPSIVVDGELQADAALVPSVAASKAPGSVLEGKANCLIFPDLNGGNIGYKLVQRIAKAEAYGPLLQGIAKPINDLSRGCSVDDIVGVVAITVVQAQQGGNE